MADPYRPYQRQPYPLPGQAPGAYQPVPPYGQSPGYGSGGGYEPPPGGRGNAGPIIAVIVSVVLIIGGVIGVAALSLTRDRQSSPPSPTQPATSAAAPQAPGGLRPTKYYDSEPSSVYTKMSDRSVDPEPVTLDEVFNGDTKRLPQYGPFRGLRAKLVGSRLDTDCTATVWGEGLKARLREGECTAVVRGLYVEDGNRHLGQFVAINLRDVTSAQQVVAAMDPEEAAAGFVNPLLTAPAQRFGRSYTEARAEIYGHYVVMTWVQAASGTESDDLIPWGVIVHGAYNFIIKRGIGLD